MSAGTTDDLPRPGGEAQHYLSDIRELRQLLARADLGPIYEPWAFLAWGALLAAGSVLHFLLGRGASPAVSPAAIWVSVAVAMGLVEAITTVRNMRGQSLTVLSRPVARYVLTLVGGTAAFVLLAAVLVRVGAEPYVPLVAVVGAGFFFIALASATDAALYIHGFLLIALATVLFVLDVRDGVAVLVGGGGGALAMAAAAVSAWRVRERRQ